MIASDHALQVVRPKDARRIVGQWVRLVRQRQGLTQTMLSSRSGVPVATLSRLERLGLGGVDNLMRTLQALGELDGFHAHLQERLRQASLPLDLSELPRQVRPRQRVRICKPKRAQP